jgi:hypothetical protein
VSGGPDWLFGLMLAAGAVALVYGFVWVFLLSMQGRIFARRPAQPAWRRWGLAVVMLLNLALLAFEDSSQPGVLVGIAVELLVMGPALATTFVVVRRASLAGTFPGARRAPLGMFWVSVVVSGTALAVAVTSLSQQIALGHSC